MEANRQITDIERAACTILANDAQWIKRPGLRPWVEQITTEPAFAEYLDGTLADAIVDRARFEAPNIIGGLHEIDYMLDEAIYRLAAGVVEFRRANRAEGDQTSPIGFGFTVTTSLAAKVAEYVSYLHQSYAVECQRIEDETR
jgi:hypothetical protein